MAVKRMVTGTLLIFVAATLCVQMFKGRRVEEVSPMEDGVHLLFFHARVRCPTCRTMEILTRETLAESFSEELHRGDFDFAVCDYESGASQNPARKLSIATAGLVLVEVRNGDLLRTANLLKECWLLVGDGVAFKEMLRIKTEEFLRGDRPAEKNTEETRTGMEIELDPAVNLFENEE